MKFCTAILLLPFLALAAATEDTPSLRGLAAALKDEYIVIFKDDKVQDVDAEVGRLTGKDKEIKPKRIFKHVIKGFSGKIPPGQLQILQKDPNVLSIEADGIVTKNAIQTNAPWGLDRLDQPDLPLDNEYTYSDVPGDTLVHAYIIDTGILGSHDEFAGRISTGQDYVDDGGGWTDCDGHGTHVAGTVGGSTYGVAKNVILHAVRVLDCDGQGSFSDVISGMDWVAAQCSGGTKKCVANASLGGGFSSSANAAANRLVDAGVPFFVAAGNSNADACDSSPASATKVVTVASSTNTDFRSSFSNYGSCVEIFAPGSSITSSYIGSNSATRTLSGTSMASPHACGAAARLLAEDGSIATTTVFAEMQALAVPGKISNVNGSPNLLLQSNEAGPQNPGEPNTPAPDTPAPDTPAPDTPAPDTCLANGASCSKKCNGSSCCCPGTSCRNKRGTKTCR